MLFLGLTILLIVNSQDNIKYIFSSMKFSSVYVLLTGFILLSSCGSEPLKINVDNIAVPKLTIDRLEKDVFTMDTTDVQKATDALTLKYGKFYASFISGIINNGGLRDSSYSTRIKAFISDSAMHAAYLDCERKYPTTDELNAQISDVFKHYSYYFPDKPLPRVITMMSGFNYPSVVQDSTLALGLEMYLGKDDAFYQMLTLPRYKTMFMNKENMLPDAVRTWMMNEFPYEMDQTDFISEIVYMGKIMYLTDALMPEVADTMKIQYTKKQLDYCTQNEFNVWSYFAAQKLLYTTDQAEIMKFTSDGPFTAAFSKESAPRIGYWIGWQIVRQYMKNNPKTSLAELMKLNNAQQFLAKAKYKPSK